MKRRGFDQLSRRERQIMEAIYRTGQATATEVLESLPDPPSYSTVRALLRILETKGHLRHVADGTRYVFLPVVAPDRARRSAIQSLLETFFEGSREKAVAALLDASRSELSDTELDRISQLIENAREEGR
ncbi:MAG TPA: BlaI/MecI/CopY family transcriptional regulator [Thermoanaerobaculia bacterium]